VKLIAPQYVKPFLKRQKNDMADAEAIAEAAQRPSILLIGFRDVGPRRCSSTIPQALSIEVSILKRHLGWA
jgi:transposase